MKLSTVLIFTREVKSKLDVYEDPLAGPPRRSSNFTLLLYLCKTSSGCVLILDTTLVTWL